MPLSFVGVSALPLDRYRELLDAEEWEAFEDARARSGEVLAGRVVWNVNSTARGGGVAEMLRPLLAYARGAGVDARWGVITGSPPFFALTKRLHNRLHGHPGDGGPLGPAEHELYRATLAEAAAALARLARAGDIVILHDPQTAGLVPALERDIRVVWRSHIGRDGANANSEEAWEFLRPYIEHADAWIFSRAEYAPPGLDRDRIVVVAPSIDVFSPKNQELDDATAHAVLTASGLMTDGASVPARFTRVDGTPGRVDRQVDLLGAARVPADAQLVTQVSRWDRLKDPLGVLQGFVEHVAPATEAHLVVAGPATAAVSDDPEGAAVLDEVRRTWFDLAPEVRERVHLVCLPMEDAEENAAMVNALQRRSAVVVQKSLAEGFGLTVGEAMWKARPVVASAVGGILDQIEDGISGVLLRDPTDLDAYGRAVRELLADPVRAAAIGAAARERVRGRFMSTRHLVQYEQLFETLAQRPSATVLRELPRDAAAEPRWTRPTADVPSQP
jgi:trehalose synthase